MCADMLACAHVCRHVPGLGSGTSTSGCTTTAHVTGAVHTTGLLSKASSTTCWATTRMHQKQSIGEQGIIHLFIVLHEAFSEAAMFSEAAHVIFSSHISPL